MIYQRTWYVDTDDVRSSLGSDLEHPVSDMRNGMEPEPGEELVRYFGAWEAPPNAFTGAKVAGWYWRNVSTLGAWAGPTRHREVAIRSARDNSAPERWF